MIVLNSSSVKLINLSFIDSKKESIELLQCSAQNFYDWTKILEDKTPKLFPLYEKTT